MAGCQALLPWPLIDTIPWQNPLDLGGVHVCVCFKALPLLYLWKRGLSVKYETVINSQTLLAVFSRVVFLIDVFISALDTANKNVLALLCKECTRVGKIWGILFVLVQDLGSQDRPCFLCAYTFKKWKTSDMEQELLP